MNRRQMLALLAGLTGLEWAASTAEPEPVHVRKPKHIVVEGEYYVDDQNVGYEIDFSSGSSEWVTHRVIPVAPGWVLDVFDQGECHASGVLRKLT